MHDYINQRELTYVLYHTSNGSKFHEVTWSNNKSVGDCQDCGACLECKFSTTIWNSSISPVDFLPHFVTTNGSISVSELKWQPRLWGQRRSSSPKKVLTFSSARNVHHDVLEFEGDISCRLSRKESIIYYCTTLLDKVNVAIIENRPAMVPTNMTILSWQYTITHLRLFNKLKFLF